MKNLSPELNNLMWQIAEARDDAAIEEFVAKHPDLRAELISRVNMVQGLKGSKPHTPKVSTKFLPSPRSLNRETPRALALTVVIFLVAAGAFATMGILRFIENRNTTATVVTPEKLRPVSANNGPQIEQTVPRGKPEPGPMPDEKPVQPLRAEEPFQRPVTIVAKNMTLDMVLNDIAIQAGLDLQSAPGMPEAMVEIDFRETPAIQVLEALGQTFGFTALIQTSSSALLIPARDQNDPRTPIGSGSVRPSEPSNRGGKLTPLPGLNNDTTQSR